MTEEYGFEPLHKEMGRHIASGIFNTGIVQLVKVLCQFGSIVVLSRLLPPPDFGLLAMAGPICGFIALFQDFGLSQATVQKPRISHNEINAFFWINIGVGAALTVLIVAISPLASWYYGEPRVGPLTAAMGMLILLSAAGNQHNAILTRRMNFGALAVNGMLGAVSGLAASIVFALILKSYWALYWGMAIGTIVPVIGVWIASRWRPTAPRLVPGLRKMIHFGAGLTGAGVANFLSGNMDNILIGHRWGDQDLGLYDRAYKLLLFPLQRIVGPVSGTMVPVLSRLTSEPARYRGIYLKTVSQLTLASWPGIIWAIILNDTLVPTLLGQQWASSAPIFEPLAIAGLAQVIGWFSGSLLISQGRAKEYALWAVINAVVCVVAFLIGLPYGPRGVAIAYAASGYALAPFYWYSITRRGPVGLRDMIRAILPQIAGGLFSAIVVIGYRELTGASSIMLLAGGFMLSYAASTLVMSLLPGGRETLKQTLQAGNKILRHAITKT